MSAVSRLKVGKRGERFHTNDNYRKRDEKKDEILNRNVEPQRQDRSQSTAILESILRQGEDKRQELRFYSLHLISSNQRLVEPKSGKCFRW